MFFIQYNYQITLGKKIPFGLGAFCFFMHVNQLNICEK
jgi:hypothetical protein